MGDIRKYGEFPGKMDKVNRKTYKKGYKKAKHGNVKDGYSKLKHVKLFENFDQDGKWFVAKEGDERFKFQAKDIDEAKELARKTWNAEVIGEADETMEFDAEPMEKQNVNETGEWSRDMDWQWVKGLTDNEVGRSEEASWIRALENLLMSVNDLGGELTIKDIKGFDLYQGPYALVDVKGKTYTVWTAEHDELFVEDHPKANTDRGFVGTPEEVANILK